MAGAKLYIGSQLVAGGGGSDEIVDHGTESGAITLDATAGRAHVLELSGAATITLAGMAAAGELHEVRLFLSAQGNAVTWPAEVSWGPSVPLLRGEVDEISLTTIDGGATVLGTHVGRFGYYSADIPPLPANAGDAWMGGFYVGPMNTTVGNIIESDAFQTGDHYDLVVSDKSVEVTRQWKIANTIAPAEARTLWNGLGATQAMNSSDYPAAQYCLGLPYDVNDGGSPWYLPALDELELCYRKLKPTTDANQTNSYQGDFPPYMHYSGDNPSSEPPGVRYVSNDPVQTSAAAFKTSGAQAFAAVYYWSATEYNATNSWGEYFAGSASGRQGYNSKAGTNSVRPVRRVIR